MACVLTLITDGLSQWEAHRKLVSTCMNQVQGQDCFIQSAYDFYDKHSETVKSTELTEPWFNSTGMALKFQSRASSTIMGTVTAEGWKMLSQKQESDFLGFFLVISFSHSLIFLTFPVYFPVLCHIIFWPKHSMGDNTHFSYLEISSWFQKGEC